MPFRPGSVGALMDEYERAARELRTLLLSMTDGEYEAIADPDTKAEECRSVQTMMRHVVHAAYGYIDSFRRRFEMSVASPQVGTMTRSESVAALDTVLHYTDEALRPHYTMSEDDMDLIAVRMRWGAIYSIDQMLEHAVMHIHRHRRQTEKFLEKLRRS